MRSVSISIAAYCVPRCCVSADPEFESPLGRMWATWSSDALRLDRVDLVRHLREGRHGASWTTCTSDSKAWSAARRAAARRRRRVEDQVEQRLGVRLAELVELEVAGSTSSAVEYQPIMSRSGTSSGTARGGSQVAVEHVVGEALPPNLISNELAVRPPLLLAEQHAEHAAPRRPRSPARVVVADVDHGGGWRAWWPSRLRAKSAPLAGAGAASGLRKSKEVSFIAPGRFAERGMSADDPRVAPRDASCAVRSAPSQNCACAAEIAPAAGHAMSSLETTADFGAPSFDAKQWLNTSLAAAQPPQSQLI